MIWLFGDSILQGQVMRGVAPHWPASARALEQPVSLLNLMLSGDEAAYGGNTSLTHKADRCAALIQKMRRNCTIGSDDTIVLLDVGEHPCDADALERLWYPVLGAAEPTRTVLCGGFDNGAKGRPDCRYDLPFDGRTMNDAIRSAAEAFAHVRWLPLSDEIASYHAQCVDLGASAYFPDGMHLNVWGQLRLCMLILSAIDIEPQCDPAARLYLTHWRELGAPNRSAAEQMVALALPTHTAVVKTRP